MAGLQVQRYRVTGALTLPPAAQLLLLVVFNDENMASYFGTICVHLLYRCRYDETIKIKMDKHADSNVLHFRDK